MCFKTYNDAYRACQPGHESLSKEQIRKFPQLNGKIYLIKLSFILYNYFAFKMKNGLIMQLNVSIKKE